jgi:uncharacterized protein (TIGR03546 family)
MTGAIDLVADYRRDFLFDKEKWKKRIKMILSLDSHPGHISAGLAVGVFISFTPFYGLHLLMAVVASFLFRLNKLSCITGTWVNNPFTVVPVTVMSYKLGRVLLGLPPARIHIRELNWQFVKSHATSLVLGSSILGFIAAVLSYFICYYLIVTFRQKDVAMKEMTEEMEETGEDMEM